MALSWAAAEPRADGQRHTKPAQAQAALDGWRMSCKERRELPGACCGDGEKNEFLLFAFFILSGEFRNLLPRTVNLPFSQLLFYANKHTKILRKNIPGFRLPPYSCLHFTLILWQRSFHSEKKSSEIHSEPHERNCQNTMLATDGWVAFGCCLQQIWSSDLSLVTQRIHTVSWDRLESASAQYLLRSVIVCSPISMHVNWAENHFYFRLMLHREERKRDTASDWCAFTLSLCYRDTGMGFKKS